MNKKYTPALQANYWGTRPLPEVARLYISHELSPCHREDSGRREPSRSIGAHSSQCGKVRTKSRMMRIQEFENGGSAY
jgi:hypothetical protein